MRKPRPPVKAARSVPPRPRPAPPASAAPKPMVAPKPTVTEHGLWLWGWHTVTAALANPERKLLRLVATEEAAGDLAAALRAGEGPAPQILARAELDRLLPPGAVHQGVALLTRPLKGIVIEDVLDAAGPDRAIVVALDQVTDPHNVGAVLRSAAAFGALAVIVPERHAPEVSGTLAKAASGAVEQVKLLRVVNLVRSLDRLKQDGFWVVGLEAAAERTLASLALTGKIVLVLGSEGDGMRRLVRETCDLTARLPMSGAIASLNVSNAAAIALYELSRDR